MEIPTLFDFLYYCITVSTLAALAAVLMKAQRLGVWLSYTVLAANLVSWLVISFTACRIPIYGHFEIIVQLCLFLSLLAVRNSRTKDPEENAASIDIGI